MFRNSSVAKYTIKSDILLLKEKEDKAVFFKKKLLLPFFAVLLTISFVFIYFNLNVFYSNI